MIQGHGGNIYGLSKRLGCEPHDIIDMSSNVNPLGPMPEMMAHIQSRLDDMVVLPETDAAGIIHAFSQYHDVPPDQVLAGNGTTQFIYSLPMALGCGTALIQSPTYSDYQDACAMHGCRVVHLIAGPDTGFRPDLERLDTAADTADIVFICNPNNPTGVLIQKSDMEQIIQRHPGTCFVVDESYLPFVQNAEIHSLIRSSLPNLAVLNSMSKIFRIPGLRIGFIKSSPEIIRKIQMFMLPWSVNSLAQAAVYYLMTEPAPVEKFVRKTRQFLETERSAFINCFPTPSLIQWFNSTTSFILGKLPPSVTAERICRALADDGILIRDCSNFKGLSDQYIRVSLKTGEINRMITGTLSTLTGRMTLSQ